MESNRTTTIRRTVLLLLLLAQFAGSNALADGTPRKKFDFSDWAAIPVLHNGRTKPFEVFAAENVIGVAGKSSLTPNSPYTVAASDVISWPALEAELKSPSHDVTKRWSKC